LFQVGCPKKIYLGFFGLIPGWLALKILFGLLALFWPFDAEKFPLKVNLTIPYFWQHMQNFCNK